jgi:hemin uptake protein HemP
MLALQRLNYLTGVPVTNDPSPDTGPQRPPEDSPQDMESRTIELTPATMREVNSRDLMRGDREIVIRHGNDAYRLSVTRSGKLILRK